MQDNPSGFLVDHQIEGRDFISPLDNHELQMSSVDLQIGQVMWEVSGMPSLSTGFRPAQFIPDYNLNQYGPGHLENGKVTLTPGKVYLVEMLQGLNLPEGMCGRTDAKSSLGRIDVYCAVLAEGSTEFDVIPPGYQGKLYMVIVPQSFPVRIRTGVSMVQLRLFYGRRQFLDHNELLRLHNETQLLQTGADPVIFDDGLALHLDLLGSPSNYVAVRGGKPINLWANGELTPENYFRVKNTDTNGNLFLETGEFLLAKTKERVRIPLSTCAEMTAHRREHGEVRWHYAGFIDPGFGRGRNNDIDGSAVVCEIRNLSTVPIMLSDNQVIGMLKFEYLQAEPRQVYGDKSHYQGQTEIALAKYFKPYQAEVKPAQPVLL